MDYLSITLLDENTVSISWYTQQGFKWIKFLPNNLAVTEQVRKWFLYESLDEILE